MENSYSSLVAKGFAMFSSHFVLISIVAMTLNTVRKYTIYKKSALNFVDLLAVMPYFIQIIFEIFTDVNDASAPRT